VANTIDVTQAQYFIPEIWANTALDILRSKIFVAQRVLRDTDVASFTTGDVLHIPYPGTLAASAKSAGTEYTLAQPSGEAEVQVTLNQHYAVSFVVEDIVRAQANQDVMSRYSEAAAIALAENIEAALIGEIDNNTSNAVGTYGTDLTAAILRSAWKAMTDAKAPEDQRHMLINTKDWIALLDDSDLANFFAWQRPEAFSRALVDNLYGFEVGASQLIVTNTVPAPDETTNIAWRTDGAILAMRGLPEPPAGSGAVAANVRDPESGLVMRSLMGYDTRLGGVQVTLEVLYGVKTLKAEKCLVVKS
jgi:coat protein Gp5